jgi:thioredoxin reductase
MAYEVIIVGAGPAGIFAALTLEKLGVEPVRIIEKG